VTAHSFPRIREPKLHGEIQTVVCRGCGIKIVRGVRTGGTLPAGVLSHFPGCDDCLVLGVMES